MQTSITRSAHEFSLSVDGTTAGHLSYRIEEGSMLIEYVEVDPSRRGQGLGEKLVDAAVQWATTKQYAVVPICSYARAVLKRRK